MKRKAFVALTLIAIISLAVFAMTRLSSSIKSDEYFEINPAFRHYISGFTSGVVSTNANITVKLNFDYATDEQVGAAILKTIFLLVLV